MGPGYRDRQSRTKTRPGRAMTDSVRTVSTPAMAVGRSDPFLWRCPPPRLISNKFRERIYNKRVLYDYLFEKSYFNSDKKLYFAYSKIFPTTILK